MGREGVVVGAEQHGLPRCIDTSDADVSSAD